MNLSFTNGTGQQQQWFHDAVSLSGYDFSTLSVGVTVEWSDPSVVSPAHGAFACTVEAAGLFTIYIRPDLDAPNRDPLYTGKQFYMETVIHELGHVAQEHLSDQATDHNQFCGMFGAPTSDWDISEATPQGWSQAVKESVAETFKDLFLTQRKFDNRTNWKLPQTEVAAFVAKIGTAPNVDLTHSYNDGSITGTALQNPYWSGGGAS